MSTKILLIVATLLVLSNALSADTLNDRLLACADETDDAARLSCYDRATANAAAAEAAVPAEPEPAPQSDAAPEPPATPQPVATPEPAVAPAAPVAESPPAHEPEPDPAPTELSPVEAFGMTAELEKKRGDDAKAKELTEISAIVTAVSKRTRGQYVVSLDNGQVWTEKDAEPYLRIKVGDQVRIKKVRLGGYRLVGRGNRSTDVVRID